MDYLFGTPTRKFGNAAMALLLKQGIEKAEKQKWNRTTNRPLKVLRTF
ncbi:hypothetical protein NC99_43480 [Sunxiuqinia dokdonensis]|uniref:Uncharacterized protein n=1 Tax=Sunxiuqinia dokdonensis TaxID=1409788 RepID=A0A0L8V352_9BACT|nr:hypothetical protein NC99_43480 [Sunxiuqinia dokdonensis]